MYRNCLPQNRNEGQVPSTQEAKNMGQEARTIPKICAVLEDHQEVHNSNVVEVEGDIAEQIVYVLITLDPLIAISPLDLLRCAL